MSNLEEIKDCPFCGNGNPDCDLAPSGWIVECSDCPANYDRQETKSAAIAGWNRRAALESAEPGSCWKKHDGRDMPTPEGRRVTVRLKNRIEDTDVAANFNWRWSAPGQITDLDIIEYHDSPITPPKVESGQPVAAEILAESLYRHIKHGDAAHQEWLCRESLVWCREHLSSPPPESAALKALRELVELKALKDTFDERKQDVPTFADAAVLEGIAQEYQRRKPAAWEAARAVVEGKSNG